MKTYECMVLGGSRKNRDPVRVHSESRNTFRLVQESPDSSGKEPREADVRLVDWNTLGVGHSNYTWPSTQAVLRHTEQRTASCAVEARRQDGRVHGGGRRVETVWLSTQTSTAGVRCSRLGSVGKSARRCQQLYQQLRVVFVARNPVQARIPPLWSAGMWQKQFYHSTGRWSFHIFASGVTLFIDSVAACSYFLVREVAKDMVYLEW